MQFTRSLTTAALLAMVATSAEALNAIEIGKTTLSQVAKTDLFGKYDLREQVDPGRSKGLTLYTPAGELRARVLVLVSVDQGTGRVKVVSAMIQRELISEKGGADKARRFIADFLEATVPSADTPERRRLMQEFSGRTEESRRSGPVEAFLGRKEQFPLQLGSGVVLFKNTPASGSTPQGLWVIVGDMRVAP